MPFESLRHLPTIRVSQIQDVLTDALALRYPIMFWGAHGCGKSQSVRDWATRHGLETIIVNLQAVEPTDLAGIPIPQDGQLVMSAPILIPVKEKTPNWKGVIFFDEITEADPRSKVALLSVLNERRIGQWHLPDGAVVVAAGNPEEEGSLSPFFSRPLADRLLHFHVCPTVDEFLDYALQNGLHPAVAAYLRVNPSSLYGKEEENSPYAAPSPRSWFRVSEVLKLHLRHRNHNSDFTRSMVASIIGVPEATAFFQSLAAYQIDTLAVLANPTRIKGLKVTYAEAIRLSYEVLAILKEDASIDQWNNAPLVYQALYENKALTKEGYFAVTSEFIKLAVIHNKINVVEKNLGHVFKTFEDFQEMLATAKKS